MKVAGLLFHAEWEPCPCIVPIQSSLSLFAGFRVTSLLRLPIIRGEIMWRKTFAVIMKVEIRPCHSSLKTGRRLLGTFPVRYGMACHPESNLHRDQLQIEGGVSTQLISFVASWPTIRPTVVWIPVEDWSLLVWRTTVEERQGRAVV